MKMIAQFFVTMLLAISLPLGLVNAQQESKEDPDDSKRMTRSDRKILVYEENLSELYDLRDTVAIIETGQVRITLHQLKIRMLDARLAELRKHMIAARQHNGYIDKAIKDGMEPEKLAWVLRQDQPVSDAQIDGKQVEPKETIRRHQAWLETRTDQLDQLYLAINEEFKFHYEKAAKLEIIDERIVRIRAELKKIRERRYEELIIESIASGVSRRNRDKIVEKSYLSALKRYAELAQQLDLIADDRAVVSTPDATRLLTLHRIKVLELDSYLDDLRSKMSNVRLTMEYVDTLLNDGNAADIATGIWILVQEQVLRPPNESDRESLSSREIMQRAKLKLQRDIDILDKTYAAANEEFKFHFVKAATNEQKKSRINGLVVQAVIIGKYLPEDRRKIIELDAKIRPPVKASSLSLSQEEQLTNLLAELIVNPKAWDYSDEDDKLEAWIKNLGPQSNSIKKSDMDNLK